MVHPRFASPMFAKPVSRSLGGLKNEMSPDSYRDASFASLRETPLPLREILAFSDYFWAQMNSRVSVLLLFLIACIGEGCANITAPTGGKKDTIPPKLVSIEPADSLLDTNVKRIEMHFDEYITTSDVSKEVELSPILAVQPVVTSNNKHVIVKIVDSLLEPNTTYRLSFGKAIKDLHESNPFMGKGKTGYTYTFSTGPYFDSLELKGKVISATTGLPDSGGVLVVLYSEKDKNKDSAVVKHKPKYVTKANSKGEYIFKGLPGRSFRIYALKDPNNNLIYDGAAAGEMIAFNEQAVTPGDTSQKPVLLRLFSEVVDTANKNADSVKKATDSIAQDSGFKRKNKDAGNVSYSVNLDTTNAAKRTFDITRPISLKFNKTTQLNKDKISLSFDSSGTAVTANITISADTAHPLLYHIFPGTPGDMQWLEDKIYTLRLAKGFAKDTAGKDIMPSRYVFRSQEDDDYGKIQMHLPAKYFDSHFLLMVTTEKDTVYQKPVLDTIVNLVRLKPSKYTFRIIADKNGNGKWDTGDLFGKLQPEEVIPYREDLKLRAGFELVIDFEEAPKPISNTKDKAPSR